RSCNSPCKSRPRTSHLCQTSAMAKSSVLDAVVVEALVKMRARVGEGLADACEILRVGARREVVDPSLRPLDERQHVGNCRLREKVLAGDAHIHGRGVGLNTEPPAGGGPEVRRATCREP